MTSDCNLKRYLDLSPKRNRQNCPVLKKPVKHIQVMLRCQCQVMDNPYLAIRML
jgi:hypothetical protein